MTPVTSLGPRIMEGRFITLEPLEERHHEAIAATVDRPDLWQFMPFKADTNGVARRLKNFADEIARGQQIALVVRRKSDAAIVGSTSYFLTAPEHARVEIGATWYRSDVQGSFVNPEAKYLLLKNAFAANYHRVEFKTDARNARSRAALAKLGAREEGILRGHMWMPQGYHRDSVYFSILAPEWPALQAQLEARLRAFE
jgi:RimJ/RimL family protein N-acetyltransferase